MSDFGKLVAASRAYYEDALAKFGDHPRGVNWRDSGTQNLRFDVLAGVGDLNGRTVHDVGCGLAHFHDFLSARGLHGGYIGSDISKEMIAAARRRIGSGVALHVADILADSPAPWMEADYVVNSGIFTVRGAASPDDWWGFVQAMAKRMFEMARVGIAFNVMTSHVDYRDDHLFYLDPGAALAYCVRELNRKVVVRHDYPALWEYTVYVYR